MKVVVRLFVILFFTYGITSCKRDYVPVERSIDEVLINGIQVVVNPHEICPQCAELTFESTEPVKFSYEVLGDLPYAHEDSYYQTNWENTPIIGLYPAESNEVRILIEFPNGDYAKKTLHIQTDSAYSGNPDISVVSSNVFLMNSPFYLVDAHFARPNQWYASRPFVFDQNGDIRWQLFIADNHDFISWPLKKLANGNVFLANNEWIFEYSITGELLNTLNAGGANGYWFHHDIIELPNGNFVGLATKAGSTMTTRSGQTVQTIEDYIIELDRNSGSVITEWDLKQILDVNREIHSGPENGDWFHGNSVYYDESDNSLIVSGRHQGVIKVDWQNNLKWIVSPHFDWGTVSGDDYSSFLLQPLTASGLEVMDSTKLGFQSETSFDWPWVQHSAKKNRRGNLILFDNGWNRHYEGNGTPQTNYSRFVEYGIEESNKTITQLYSYGESLGFDYYSMIVSNVDELSNGNYLFSSCFTFTEYRSRLIEFDPLTQSTIFEAKLKVKDATANPSASGFGAQDIMYRISSFEL